MNRTVAAGAGRGGSQLLSDLPSPVWAAPARRAIAWVGDRLWLLLPPLTLPALWTFIAYGLPRSYDGDRHLLRLGLLDYHIRHGVFYPRWAPEMLLGYGYPRFSFHAPGSYYLAEALHLLGLSFYWAFIASFALALLFAGFGMYRLARDVFGARGPLPALVAAVAYVYSPFLLADIYIRGDLGETVALAFLPWTLWSARRLLRSGHPGHYLLPFVLTLGGIAVTHTAILILAPPLVLGYMAVHWWLGGRSPCALGWALVALACSMGVSAFYWLPVLGERGYLADTGYAIARSTLLPQGVWRWDDFLDVAFFYNYSFARPVRLGLVRTIVAAAGLILARRRDAEWLFFLAAAVLTGLSIGAWSLPIWLSSDILAALQHPWRLLSILSLPLAIFAGGAVLPFRQRRQLAAAGLLMTLLIVAQSPRLGWMHFFSPVSVDNSPAVMAQWETVIGVFGGAEGSTSLQEFRPRWVDETLILSGAQVASAKHLEIAPSRGNAFDLSMRVQSTGGPMHFTGFYFPGWQVQVDGRAVAAYPSTNLGLLTVDLPAGEHEVGLAWVGTRLQQAARVLSLLSLALLAGLCWWCMPRRWWAAVPIGLLVIALMALGWPHPQQAIVAPGQAVASGGVRLAGYRSEQDGRYLYIHPYWVVETTPAEDWRARWQLLDESGAVRAELLSKPYYNTSPGSNWPPGTLVDDAYRMALPPGLAAGEYWLAASIQEGDASLARKSAPIGSVTISMVPPAPRGPAHPLDVLFKNEVRLEGYDVTAPGRGLALDGRRTEPGAPMVLRAGDDVTYTLFWRAEQPVEENYHGFVHLVDVNGRPLAQEDHLPGPVFRPPLLWDSYYLQPDVYRLQIPPDALGGLYWPSVGLYEQDLDLLEAREGETGEVGDHYRLPPVKVVGRPQTPQQRAAARFAGVGQLLGYDLMLPEGGVRAGGSFSVTLYFMGSGPSEREYTRFVHLYDAALGMAGQHDSLPADGVNPTSAWVGGETVVDRVEVPVSEAARPGEYTLYVGFYDAGAGGERAPAWDNKGQPISDGRVPLTKIRILP